MAYFNDSLDDYENIIIARAACAISTGLVRAPPGAYESRSTD